MADTTKVLAGRDIKVYVAPYATTNAMPVDSAYATAWGAPYVDKGYTIGGVHLSFGQTWTDERVDQELDPVFVLPAGRTLTASTNLAEFTAPNARDAFGLAASAVTTVAAATGTRGHDDLSIVGGVMVPTYLTVGFEVRHPGDGEAIRLVSWRCLVTGSPSVSVTPDVPVQLAYSARALPDTNTSPSRIAVIRDIIPAA